MGMKIGNKHSFDDWHLIMTNFSISSPAIKTKIVELPGVDGTLDLTEYLTGYIPYADRTLNATFIYPDKDVQKYHDLYSDISNYCHGKVLPIIFDGDKKYFWEGRIHVEANKEDQIYSTFSLSATVKPYKQETCSSLSDWLWDSFNFERDIAREYKDIPITIEKRINIVGSKNKPIPILFVKGQLLLEVEDKIYPLKEGKNILTDIILEDKVYQFLFKGTGTVSIEYRGGSL